MCGNTAIFTDYISYSLYIGNEGVLLDCCVYDRTLLGALKTDQKDEPGDRELETSAFLIF